MAVTIYDIAKKIGCSPSAVSLAMSNSPKISESTKEKIRRASKELGYSPNYNAKCLIQNKSYTIGVIAPNLYNPIFGKMISGITHKANESGYSVLLGLSEQSLETERANIQMLSQKRVDGLVIFPSFLNEIFPDFIKGEDDTRIPLVLCGTSTRISENILHVKCNNKKGGYIATEHLIKTGCRHIAIICAVDDETQATSRITGYKNALENYGIPCDDELIVFCSSDSKDIYDITTKLIKEKPVDAIFCLYDYMALPVIKATLAMNKRIPEDISIIGYDNIDIDADLPISLSSVDTHAYDVGCIATKKLIFKIENPNESLSSELLSPELVIRDSTKPLKE